ncbi:Molybdenum cofactor guanylyltransferase [Microbacterium lemovicicum]|uniref:Molybdenum cofactor guanylyltransferase n=1 Tax=Microbacterium lemovicicum TaxID=1072463 RepID=A0A3Q9J0Q9_9MICO|nr:NTP transferase domain-containing protein [Microbacterium lemovicicum]AZS36767.1 Molybdenum cofactor guanylyltransferase [Microbacterium lemovicicum]
MTQGLGDHTAIILAGGAARRLGGVAKPLLEVRGRSLLQRAVDAARGAGCADVVVVGPPASGVSGVRTVREDPAFGGPVAAIAAALPAVATDWVLVLAADLPRSADAVALLVGATTTAADGTAADATATAGTTADGTAADATATAGTTADATATAGTTADATAVDGACLVDAEGRRQPLLARYRTAALRARLSGLGDPTGASVRQLLQGLRITEIRDAAGMSRDVDTWEDVWIARLARDDREGVTMAAADAPLPPEALDAWTAALADRFGLAPEDIPIALVLDLARDVAHGVARPAAPLSAFVAGFVAGRAGGTQADVEETVAAVVELARGWRVD